MPRYQSIYSLIWGFQICGVNWFILGFNCGGNGVGGFKGSEGLSILFEGRKGNKWSKGQGVDLIVVEIILQHHHDGLPTAATVPPSAQPDL